VIRSLGMHGVRSLRSPSRCDVSLRNRVKTFDSHPRTSTNKDVLYELSSSGMSTTIPATHVR